MNWQKFVAASCTSFILTLSLAGQSAKMHLTSNEEWKQLPLSANASRPHPFWTGLPPFSSMKPGGLCHGIGHLWSPFIFIPNQKGKSIARIMREQFNLEMRKWLVAVQILLIILHNANHFLKIHLIKQNGQGKGGEPIPYQRSAFLGRFMLNYISMHWDIHWGLNHN